MLRQKNFDNYHFFEKPLKNGKAKQVKVVQPAMTGDT